MPDELGCFAGGGIALASVLDSRRAREQEHVELTLKTLSTAYYSTQAYFADLDSGVIPSRRDQLELAEKWDHMSVLIRRYDKKLSSRFSLKSRFWREGGAWEQQQVAYANIGLENIHRDGRVMLMLKYYAD